MKPRIRLAALFLIATLLPLGSFATMPVFDAAAFEKLVAEYEQLKQQYDLLQQTYQNAQQQLAKAKEIASNAEGHYLYGDLLNNATDLKNREWSPNSWQEALEGIAGGNPARYQQLVEQYQQDNKTLSPDDYKKGASVAQASVYQKQIAANQAVTVNSSYAFNDINTQLNNIHQISQRIELAPNEKAAIDLSTRMQTEIAYVQVQMLKQMALLNEQIARSNADNIAAETQSSQFNRLPNE